MTQKLLMFFITVLLFANTAYARASVSNAYHPGDTVRVVVTSNNTADECSLVVYDPDFDKHQGGVLPYHSGGGTVFTWTGFWIVPATPEFGDWSGITVLWDTVGVNTRVGGGNTIWSIADTFLTVTTVLDKAGYALTSGERTSIANRVLQDSSKYQAKTVSLASGEVDKIAYAVEGSLSIPTVGEIADGVWDEVRSGHVDAGTFGKYLDAQVSDKDGYTLTTAEKESMAVMSARETLKDSSHYKSLLTAEAIASKAADSVGFVAAPTVGEVANGVWDETRSGHTGAGAFGLYLDAQVSDKDGYTLTVAERALIADASADSALKDSSHYKSLLTAEDIATRLLADTSHYQAKGAGMTQADKETVAVMAAREVLDDSSHYKSLLTAAGIASVTADSVLKDSLSYQGAAAEGCTLSAAQVALIAGATADTVLQDSTHYQGSASGLTADAIALAMWSSLHADYADSAGSFGAYIDAKISDMGVILGSKPVRAYLKDAADSTILGNVEVQLYNKNDTTYSDLIYVSYTNTSGWIDLNLDTLTYWLRWEHPQYVASTDSFTVADDDTLQGFIFYATAFSPPSPSVDSTCVVWGRLRKATGEYAADIKVQFVLEPSDPAFYMEKLLDRRKVETMTDSSGFWSVAVYPNSRITPLGTGYKVKIWGDPVIEDTYIVPADTSASFNSLEKWDD